MASQSLSLSESKDLLPADGIQTVKAGQYFCLRVCSHGYVAYDPVVNPILFHILAQSQRAPFPKHDISFRNSRLGEY